MLSEIGNQINHIHIQFMPYISMFSFAHTTHAYAEFSINSKQSENLSLFKP